MDKMKLCWKYKKDLIKASTELELLRFIGKMLIEIWWNTNGYRNRD